MKSIKAILCALTLGACLAFFTSGCTTAGVGEERAVYSARTTVSFDADWRFHQGTARGAEAAGFDDSGWRELNVPHDWSIEGAFKENHPTGGDGGWLPSGVAWYRKHFDLVADEKGRRVFIEFDGVMAKSDVWINGQHLGQRPYGYVSFQYEITDHVHPGGNNVISVRTDTSAQPASRWYTGAGIYRHVRLVITDPVHIDQWGVFVTTPEVSAEQAVVRVQTRIVNQSEANSEIIVRSRIVDPVGNEVAMFESSTSVAAGAGTDATHQITLANPQLWDLDHPWLHQVVSQVFAGDKLLDEVVTHFGIRHFEFNSETGFWLNDRNFKIKGVCLHHACGALGAAVPLSAWERRLEKLRELGVNAVRTAHNPVAPEFLDLCDRMGFLVMDEVFDCWTVAKRKQDYHQFFEQWSKADLRDTIRRDRNHPSVILYSVGNEIHDTPREELAKGILKGLVEVCHETDPTRPVTQGLFRPNVSHDYENGLADMLDVIGTNYRDRELLQAWRDKPGRKIIGSEQGHGRSTWLDCRDHPQHAGQFLWVGIDYLGESRRWPVTSFNAGLLDRTGTPHPRALQRQSWWSDESVVNIVRRIAATEDTPTDPGYEAIEWKRRQVLFPDWTPRDLSAHEENVEVYSNCDEVELFLNGNSLGSKQVRDDAGSLNWRVPFEPGSLKAEARKSGQLVASQELRTAGAPAKIVLQAERNKLTDRWDDVAYVEAQVVDEDGVLVPDAGHLIQFDVTGPGEIAGVDSGSVVSHEPFQASQRHAFQGRSFAIIRAISSEGAITVSASAEGLQGGNVEITTASQ